MTARPNFTVSGVAATGDVPTKQVDGSVAWAAPSGGSLPAEWTAGSAGDLTIATTDPIGDDILRLEAPVGYHQTGGEGYLLRLFAGDGTDVLDFDPSGALNLEASPQEGTVAFVSMGGSTPNSSKIQAGGFGFDRIDIRGEDSNRRIFGVFASGAVRVGANAAPADNLLDAGNMALWFDDTNGAAKLMIKAKTADGTVVTGSVNLT